MLTTLIDAADGTAGEGLPWLTPTIAILTLLLGSGGVVAWVRARQDKHLGVAQQETAEDDSVAKRWQAIIEAQTRALLEPMTQRLGTLEQKVQTLETDLAVSRRRYWQAISHIRTLYTWISRHLPDDVEQTQIPAPPATLADDI